MKGCSQGLPRRFGNSPKCYLHQITIGAGAGRSFTYDANGNLVTVSNATTVISNVWDAANRLVKIYSNGTYRSEFTYDGLARRVRQVEISGSATNSDHRFLWCGTELCQERDSAGTAVSKQFCPQGEKSGGGYYYYTRDHLGSIREVVKSSGLVTARYDYDPWGRRVNVNGSDHEGDFGFTGHYYHAPSGLHLAPYRAYSAELGRWLSRDPIEENGGLNIYAYGRNDPAARSDPTGLFAPGPILIGGGTGAGIGAVIGGPPGAAIGAIIGVIGGLFFFPTSAGEGSECSPPKVWCHSTGEVSGMCVYQCDDGTVIISRPLPGPIRCPDMPKHRLSS